MKYTLVILLILTYSGFVFAQNEQAPMAVKEFGYKNWDYKNLNSDGKTDLREYLAGKKLVIVVYWAPWCHNWEHDVDYVESLYEKYKDRGLGVIGVGEYDTRDRMRAHIAAKKLTFPMVSETENSGYREKSDHFKQRKEAGDTRRWGSPWYIFLDPAHVAATGDVLTTETTIVNGELVRGEVEKYISEKLGLASEGSTPAPSVASSGPSAVCDPAKPTTALIKP